MFTPPHSAAPPRTSTAGGPGRSLDLRARFEALTQLLRRDRDLWEPRPFASLQTPWEPSLPAVARWLRGRTSAEIDALEARTRLPDDAPERLHALAEEVTTLTDVPRLPRVPVPGLDGSSCWEHVPGRKRAQIRAFVEVVTACLPEGAPLVDWCAGKGHLGRTLSRVTGRSVTLIEHQGTLCDAGARIAAEDALPCHFVPEDVLDRDAAPPIDHRSVALGLHACGLLTDRLIAHAVDRGVRGLAFASCCYHRLGDLPGHTPQSRAGRDADLPLDRGHLRLATADEVVAAAGPRAARRREYAWRLGLDLLIREATGEDAYRPLGRISRDVLALPFEAFCREMSARQALPLPSRWDPVAAERRAHDRCRETRGLALLRGLYRRAMELWIVLDRALFLVEHGRPVTLGTFCEPSASPRNLLVHSMLDRP